MKTMTENYKGGSVTSALTGQTFTWVTTPDDSDKRRAIRECDEQIRQSIAAAEARAGRKLTTRELLNGVKQVDTRPIREQIAERVTHVVDKASDGNPYAGRIAELESRLQTATPVERQQIKNRLHPLKSESAKWEATREAREARETLMTSSAVTTAMAVGQANFTLLTVNALVPQRLVDRLKTAREKLSQDGDHVAFYAELDAVVAEKEEILGEKADALKAQADALKQQAKDVRTGRDLGTSGDV